MIANKSNEYQCLECFCNRIALDTGRPGRRFVTLRAVFFLQIGNKFGLTQAPSAQGCIRQCRLLHRLIPPCTISA